MSVDVSVNDDLTMLQTDMVKLKLSSKIGKKAPIFVADYSTGRLKEGSKVKFESIQSINEFDSGIPKKQLLANTGHLSYKGTAKEKGPIRYLVGIRNKSTGKMKLYDSMYFHMKPQLSAANEVITNNNPVEKSYWEERNNLTEAFGTKAKKRLMKAQLKLGVDAEALEESLKDDSITSSPRPSTLLVEQPQMISYLPAVNKAATSLDEVFDISDIISLDIDADLQNHAVSWLQAYQSDPVAGKQNLCSFVLKLIDQTLDNLDFLKILLYYNFLVQFQHLTYADIRKKDPCPSIPQPFKQRILNMFTTVTKSETGRPGRSFPPQQKDKLVANIIVLALIVKNYCVCISDVIVDLKRVTPKQFSSIAEAIGCYITSQKVEGLIVKHAELKLPLNVVLPKFSKRQF